ncbi:MAG: Fic family protein, partial [Bacteroidota bacterium]
MEIIYEGLLDRFKSAVDFDPLEQLNQKSQERLPVDYFQFYNSLSSVYSSKIEGEEIDFDSFFKHKFMNVQYQPDYTKKADDLFNAYEFIYENELNEKNILKAHAILSKNLLPKSQRGLIRNNPMFVINEEDRIEYVACAPNRLPSEFEKFTTDLEQLQKQELTTTEIFYFAAMIHLVFVKIHPLQDGNGRTARLIEKWFLIKKIGKQAASIELEKSYYVNRKDYYNNIRKLGLDYQTLDYSQSLDFI